MNLNHAIGHFYLQLKIPAIGFSPMINTIPRAHDNNEYLNADTYLTGIEIYKSIILNLDKV